uniref:Uncharacterized protein n=1 Tax=Arundo donax TaxID=35708 RepID=A0A0A8YNK4_ARUDO
MDNCTGKRVPSIYNIRAS